MAEIHKPEPQEPPPLADELKSLCRKMDEHKLLKLLMAKRKEALTLKTEMVNALAECVDPPRLVLDSVREFMELKANVKSGQPDRRWACGIVVGGMFPFDELKERKQNVKLVFSRAILERAESMAKEWREKAQERAAAGLATGSGEGMYGMGPSEASMFLQFVAGFGLKDDFDYEFLKNLVMEFTSRRDMAKLAAPLFGEKVEDIINELLKTGKDVDAIYFIIEAGLTEKFNPVSMLKSYLSKAEKNAKDALRKGNNSSEAADEASIIERTALKHIIKCVEENKLEEDFPLTSAKKRLSNLERIKNEKKKAASGGGSRPSSNKRGHSSSGPPPPHPAKIQRFSGPYRPPFGQRNPVSPAHPNPGSRYPSPYSYPSQSAYDTGLTASPYGSTYGGSHIPGSAQAASQPPPYGVHHGENVGGPAPRVGGSYGGGQLSYGSYDYGAGALNTYPPSSYTQ